MKIQLELKENGKGAFFIEQDGKRVAEMVISIAPGNLTVHHTEVDDKLQGQGISTELLEAMVAYAREHQLKVIPLCNYVSVQFKRHRTKYKDVWNTT
jgi:predicted GNAT family acetyltransferase